ncbi:ornithine cyclodeaminase/mu-crystallin family protein [Burkholderia oklahomensis]|uniref:Ornithine cyclodeaminase/mu-crystallin family protein n=1 Tax=Burkholderia oklahomensis TaxID=342113 RepID=A0AAI8FQJ7_9BURK|nr:ornithine cyclodeaminase/mu-crystallin family protein [Burkholderia oklahomensis]AOI38331.1 ornithine cyclodeaminase [Burkholderia oklahomensis EO147]KUY48546.1 ornithine cyclodeaminase [Burkholderia oklahomensis EO147]QPS41332.1 ornithine cyclodeaminase [Burkholderia oklahomensis]
MTRFLDVHDTSRLIARVGVPRFVGELVDALRADYLRWNDFDKSPRVACHSHDGVIELMSVADSKLFAFKYVNGHPVNADRGMHTVMAFGALADVDTGYPVLLAELTLITALRTAATSVLARHWLAPLFPRIARPAAPYYLMPHTSRAATDAFAAWLAGLCERALRDVPEFLSRRT